MHSVSKEMAQKLKALATFPEDPDVIAGTHGSSRPSVSPVPRDVMGISVLL